MLVNNKINENLLYEQIIFIKYLEITILLFNYKKYSIFNQIKK